MNSYLIAVRILETLNFVVIYYRNYAFVPPLALPRTALHFQYTLPTERYPLGMPPSINHALTLLLFT
ncbi:unnamed protein product [Protopolystoma xenopodis]|uniref:Uncharacterized protein n=1 Tax=Protopolystoma xenopodis TaxID=117903 RepID=A0A448WU57_9PLAT|nr:unnamed protein product [Protopolystoma xenopodis]